MAKPLLAACLISVALWGIILWAVAVWAQPNTAPDWPFSSTAGDIQRRKEYDTSGDRSAVNLKLLTGTFTPAPVGRCFVKAQNGATPVIVQSCDGNAYEVIGSGGGGGCTCPTDTPNPTATFTGTATRTGTATFTSTPTRTATPTQSGTPTLTWTPPAVGITEINDQTPAHQFLVVGITGTDFNIDSTTPPDHIFNLPDASASARGAVNHASQGFGGVKEFFDGAVIDTALGVTGITQESGGAQSITSASDLLLADTTVLVFAADAAYTLDGTPTIDTGALDQRLTLWNSPSASFCVTLQDETQLTGSTLRLHNNGPTLTLCPGDLTQFRWDAATAAWWEEYSSTSSGITNVTDANGDQLVGEPVLDTMQFDANMQISQAAPTTVLVGPADGYTCPALNEGVANTRNICTGGGGCTMNGVVLLTGSGAIQHADTSPASLVNTLNFDCTNIPLLNDGGTSKSYCRFVSTAGTTTLADGVTKASFDCQPRTVVLTTLTDAVEPTPHPRAALPSSCTLQMGFSINAVDSSVKCTLTGGNDESGGTGCAVSGISWTSGTAGVGAYLSTTGSGCPGPTPGTGTRRVGVSLTCN